MAVNYDQEETAAASDVTEFFVEHDNVVEVPQFFIRNEDVLDVPQFFIETEAPEPENKG